MVLCFCLVCFRSSCPDYIELALMLFPFGILGKCILYWTQNWRNLVFIEVACMFYPFSQLQRFFIYIRRHIRWKPSSDANLQAIVVGLWIKTQGSDQRWKSHQPLKSTFAHNSQRLNLSDWSDFHLWSEPCIFYPMAYDDSLHWMREFWLEPYRNIDVRYGNYYCTQALH